LHEFRLYSAASEDSLFYIPTSEDKIIDIDIRAISKKIKILFSDKLEEVQQIDTIIINGKDITKDISKICQSGGSYLYLKSILIDYLVAPKALVNSIENIEIKKMCFE
jgi:hypothetical protein